MSPRETLILVAEAWRMTWKRQQPAPVLIHHSDQDNQYRAWLYQQLFAQGGVIPSPRRKDDC